MMLRKLYITFFFIFTFCFCASSSSFAASDYAKTYTPAQHEQICKQLQRMSANRPNISALNNDIIPDSVFLNIYNTTKNISNSITVTSVLGDVLMCHASHAAKQHARIAGIRIFDYPKISIWLSGLLVYFFGFMFLLSITFYVVDISFKLGFAVILLPIGIAFWAFPFKDVHEKLGKLIYIILHSAAIFVFLALTVSYALNMLDVAVGNLDAIFDAIDANDTDTIENAFSIFTTAFLVILFSLIYGLKLIGSTIPDYVNRFFPDKTFGDNVPMHHMAVQSMDFAQKKILAPTAKLAGDITKTQAGRLTEGVGNVLTGKYHSQIMTAVRNPKETLQKAQLSIAKKESKILAGGLKGYNNMRYGTRIAAANLIGNHQDREDIKAQLRQDRDKQNRDIDNQLQTNYEQAMESIDNQIANKPSTLRRANRQQRRDARNAQLDSTIVALDQEVEQARALEKIPPATKRVYYKAVRGLKNSWKVPGTILQRVGRVMQGKKPK